MRAGHARGPLILISPSPLMSLRVEDVRRCAGTVSLPKSDTNPLTIPEHPCYYPHRSNTNLTISRRNQKPREAHQTQPRTQRPSPSQRPIHGARGTSKSRHLLTPSGPVPPSLPRRWRVHRLYAARPLPGAPAESVPPIRGAPMRRHLLCWRS